MKSDGLEPDEVISGGYCGGDRRRPARVLGNHLSGSPGSVIDGSREKSGFVNLELIS